MSKKNFKGFGELDYEDYQRKLNQLQVSYFMQCLDLTNAFNGGQELGEVGRNFTRGIVEEFVKQKPDSSFIEFSQFLGFFLLKEGEITEKQYEDILNGKDV